MKKALMLVIFVLMMCASTAYAEVYYNQNFDKTSIGTTPAEFTLVPRGHSIGVVDDSQRYCEFKINMSQSQGSPYVDITGIKVSGVDDVVIETSFCVQNSNTLCENIVGVKNSRIECTKINSEVIPILKANNDYICLDFTNFNKVSVTANITSRIKGKKFDSIEALESSFNKLVEDELNNNPDNSNDNNVPAGTGAPKGGAGGVSTPSAINEQIKNNGVIFTDIKVVPWAEECIIYLYNKKIVDGKGDKEFKPNDNITRAEFVKLVSLAFPKASNNTSKTFSDVDENTWYAPYIKNAYANGWINGVSEDTFGVNNNISREDMAVILYRVANSLDIPIEKEKSVLFYDDDEISSYAKEAVNALAEGNIINGADNNKFLPKNTATRAEAAKLIYCLIKEAENDE